MFGPLKRQNPLINESFFLGLIDLFEFQNPRDLAWFSCSIVRRFKQKIVEIHFHAKGRLILSNIKHLWELIFIYCGLFCPHLGSFLRCFFFHYVSAKFHLWPSSGDLPRLQIGMLSLVTVSPVITAFHSCCLSHHVFWPSKPLAGLGRIWNRYLLTMLTWNRRDSTPLSAAPYVVR